METSGVARLQKLQSELMDKLDNFHNDLLEGTEQSISKHTANFWKVLVDYIQRETTTQAVLGSLRYDQMKTRYGAVEAAYQCTFDWIFADFSGHNPIKPSFKEWLIGGKGMYWVAGRAGSGKSTLMKYLCNHPKTRLILQRWAGSKSLVMASHFFWISGSRMQKSQEGLLSSLLNDIFTRCPDLIPTVAPSRWELCLTHTHNRDPWTRSELLEAFENLRKRSSISEKFCFFIDGLDEYDGDHAQIVRVLQDSVTSPDIKICVSSRPWNVFEKTLGINGDAKLYLEDLTRNDIRIYVEDNLGLDQRFKDLEDDEETSKRHLVDDIVNLAHGVFLWVVLVVRDLLRGLSNEDTMAVLRKRLYSLPPTLEEYFMAMLQMIDSVYREETAQIMLLALEGLEAPTLWTLSFLDKHGTRYAMEVPMREITREELENICTKTRTRVKARCSDLIEVPRISKRRARVPNGALYLARLRVDFLHRTVRDFLLTPHVQAYLHSLLKTNFHPRMYLCTTLLAQIKKLDQHHHKGLLEETLWSFLSYATSIERSGGCLDLANLNEAERVMNSHWPEMRWVSFVSMESRLAFGLTRLCILQAAIYFGIHQYVEKRLTERPELIRGESRFVPLETSLCRFTHSSARKFDMDMVTRLLAHGASPNQPSGNPNSTVWSLFLQGLTRENLTPRFRNDWCRVAEHLLLAGADPHIRIGDYGDIWKYLAKHLSNCDVMRLRSVVNSTERKVERAQSSAGPWTWSWTNFCGCARQRKGKDKPTEASPLLSSEAHS